MPASLLWYDLETFGLHPQWDRIAQFAAVRTNGEFEETDEPVDLYCRMTPDYIPDPDACIVTGITPATVAERGVTEAKFAGRIYAEMIQPGTCTSGYNTIRFDDEFVRALFYRNFYDPYKREYEQGNARWDILDLVRMCHDLRPEGMTWIRADDGRPVFKLELLAEANGIDTGQAHSAVDDVRTTISLAKLIHEAQPKLFRYFYGLRRKDEVRKYLNLQQMQPVLHTSRMFTSERGCTTIVLPLSVHPSQGNQIITCDLRQDPSEWIELPVEEIRRRVFSRNEELEPGERVYLKGIHINRSPAVAPVSTLSSDRAEVLGLDVDLCLRHARVLQSRTDLVQKIRQVYEDGPSRGYEDPELQIYSGDFFPDEDREEFSYVRTASPDDLKQHPPTFFDRRGPELLWRYIARNFNESLSTQEQARWKSFCATRILSPEPSRAIGFNDFKREVRNRLSRIDTPAKDKRVLQELAEYADLLEREILS